MNVRPSLEAGIHRDGSFNGIGSKNMFHTAFGGVFSFLKIHTYKMITNRGSTIQRDSYFRTHFLEFWITN